MDKHFVNIPLLEHIHNWGFYFTCSIKRNKKGVPNKEEKDKLSYKEIKVYTAEISF